MKIIIEISSVASSYNTECLTDEIREIVKNALENQDRFDHSKLRKVVTLTDGNHEANNIMTVEVKGGHDDDK